MGGDHWVDVGNSVSVGSGVSRATVAEGDAATVTVGVGVG